MNLMQAVEEELVQLREANHNLRTALAAVDPDAQTFSRQEVQDGIRNVIATAPLIEHHRNILKAASFMLGLDASPQESGSSGSSRGATREHKQD